ncbi:putative inactive metalloprotease YmfF [Lentibacillus kapialis]|uniref:Inactive metalloprotease YmfF n=1 Tax=Lentibacillus kapialis TaxID=340214 RepID=A0A917UZC6_9BACI|nr:pitrilysin family protein [Lentibacillus kapialis]GGK00463.1 putative inactive metalloprotease YmfF [Lentibacillus kapialis]
MHEPYEEVVTENGVHFHFVPTEKFKTISFTAKFKAPLEQETVTQRALLPYVLQQGTQSYPNRRVLQTKLDRLYGAVLSINSTKKGNHHIVTIRLETANQKFISHESDIIDEAVALFREIIYEPNQEHNAFPQMVVSREKDTLRQKINAATDDKMLFANMRLIDEMCHDERYKLHIHGYEDDIERITAENLYTYYRSMLQNDRLDIYVAGDMNSKALKAKMLPAFQRDDCFEPKKVIRDTEKYPDQPNIVIEKQQIQQAKLHFGYRTHVTFGDEDYAALQVFNGLLGGFPSSKLFINVREKNSLAYYAASKFESHKGLLFIFGGIAPQDYEHARDIMKEQVHAMKKGEFTEEEMTNTKDLIVNQLLETMDNSLGMMELLYQQVAGEITLSPEALIDGIKHVKKDEVIQVANKLDLDTIYLLTSQEGDTDG